MPWTGPTFPSLPGIGMPPHRSLQWSWEDQTALSGKRARYSLFTYPLYKWEIPLDFLRTATAYEEFQTLIGFINSLQGGVGLFGYTDPDDNAVTLQEFDGGLCDGVLTGPFQLVRSVGGNAEPVFLLNGAPSIYVNGTLKTLTTDYTIGTYGGVTFTVAPPAAAVLTWTGSYYWPCRFDDDSIDFEKFSINPAIYSTKSLKFSSEKLA
jgi:hypothetical protein